MLVNDVRRFLELDEIGSNETVPHMPAGPPSSSDAADSS
jgi:hypothetical protein